MNHDLDRAPRWALTIIASFAMAGMIWVLHDIYISVREHSNRLTALETKVDIIVDGQKRLESHLFSQGR